MKFNEFNWHDTVIKKVEIDRAQPGIEDRLHFKILDTNNEIISLIFYDVYWANLDFNFGIISEETILDAYEEDSNNPHVKKVYEKWNGDLHFDLNYYEINTNSTNSVFKIVARKFKIT